MIHVLIIADDLTGAMDAGVQFASAHVRTEVRIYTDWEQPPDISGEGVLVLDTESRHLLPQQAGKLIYTVVQAAVRQGIPYIYKKTDSALRGNVGAELMAAAKAAEVRPLPLVPAWPENGRTTKEGVHYIDGIPLKQTDMAKDILNPIFSSRVEEILSATAPCRCGSVSIVEDNWEDDADILIFDGKTGAEVDRVGEYIIQRRMLHLTAGCARFLQSVAPKLCEGLTKCSVEMEAVFGKILLVCGSLNWVSLNQVSYAVEHLGYCPIEPDGDLYSQEKVVVPQSRRLVLRSSQLRTKDALEEYLQAISVKERQSRARQVANLMGQAVRKLVHEADVGVLIVFGGDTLFSVVKELGFQSLVPVKQLSNGIVCCQAEYRGKKMALVTKAGGFGQEAVVALIEATLKNDKSCFKIQK